MGLHRQLALVASLFDARREVVRPAGEYIVAGMATMPTRQKTFPKAFRSLVRQVDRLYLYLDGHPDVPAEVVRYPNVIPILSRDVPGLHANGKLLGLTLEKRPCLYVCADDDLYFRRDFVAKLRSGLGFYGDQAVVGYHGCILARPLERYFKDRTLFFYGARLDEARLVDVLGTGAVMFSSAVLNFDVRNWPFGNMADLGLAIEAARAGIPMISLQRRNKELIPLAMNQPDSLQVARSEDDRSQTQLAREVVRLRDTPLQPRPEK